MIVVGGMDEMSQFETRGVISWCMTCTCGLADSLKEVGFRKSKKNSSVIINVQPVQIMCYE
jgi:hypothetical protein